MVKHKLIMAEINLADNIDGSLMYDQEKDRRYIHFMYWNYPIDADIELNVQQFETLMKSDPCRFWVLETFGDLDTLINNVDELIYPEDLDLERFDNLCEENGIHIHKVALKGEYEHSDHRKYNYDEEILVVEREDKIFMLINGWGCHEAIVDDTIRGIIKGEVNTINPKYMYNNLKMKRKVNEFDENPNLI